MDYILNNRINSGFTYCLVFGFSFKNKFNPGALNQSF